MIKVKLSFKKMAQIYGGNSPPSNTDNKPDNVSNYILQFIPAFGWWTKYHTKLATTNWSKFK